LRNGNRILADHGRNRYIVTANYTAGSVGVVSVEEDETLGPRTDLVTLTGETGPNRKEQAGSHPHDCPFDPAGRFVVVPDKGLDQIFVFRLHAASGKLVANNPPSVATREGARPRHIAFHPSLPVAYVINELSSTMTTYNYDTARGVLQAVQVLRPRRRASRVTIPALRSRSRHPDVLFMARTAVTTVSSSLQSTVPTEP